MRAEIFINLNPELWDLVTLTVVGHNPGMKTINLMRRHTSEVLMSVPLQHDEAEAIGRALKGEAPP